MNHILLGILFAIIVYLFFDFTIQFLFSVISRIRVEKILYQKRMNYHIHYKYFKPVSVVLAVGNNPSFLESLESIVCLSYPQFEVLMSGNLQNEALMSFIRNNHFIKVSRPYKRQLECGKIERIYEGIYKNISITVLIKENIFFSDDINALVNVARFPYVLTMNSNQRVRENALREFVLSFLEDENTIFSFGVTELKPIHHNLISILENAILTRFFTLNQCFDLWNSNLVLSSSFHFFKKDVFMECKGFSLKNKNGDITFLPRLHLFFKRKKIKYRVRYVSSARVLKTSRSSLKELMSLKKEEYLSIVKVLLHHKKLFLKPSFGALSLISYSYYFFFQFLKPFFCLIGIILSCILVINQYISMWYFLLFLFLYVLFSILTFLFNFHAKKKVFQKSPKQTERVVID